MDDQAKVLDLYEKMNHVSIDLETLNEMLNVFREDLTKNFIVDDKTYCQNEINKLIDSSKVITDSVKYDVLKDLKDNL